MNSQPKNLLEKALAVALQAHEGKKDRYDQPYILHALRVMMRVRHPDEQVVAVLHDVVEDSPTTLDDLRGAGFPEKIVQAVDALTKRKGESYDQQIDRAASNPLAKPVKLGDLQDNMDLTRTNGIQAGDLPRFNKYLSAWRRLTA